MYLKCVFFSFLVPRRVMIVGGNEDDSDPTSDVEILDLHSSNEFSNCINPNDYPFKVKNMVGDVIDDEVREKRMDSQESFHIF